MQAGAELLVTTVRGLAAGSLKEIPQTTVATGELKHAPKIFKPDTIIDWHHPATTVHNLVRGLSPYPAACTVLREKSIKVFTTRYEHTRHDTAPGTMQTDHAAYLRFATPDGWVYVEELQAEGKKRMGITEFLRGFR